MSSWIIFFVFLVDETPPWFAAHGRQDQDLQVLRWLYNDDMHESDIDITALHEDIPRTDACAIPLLDIGGKNSCRSRCLGTGGYKEADLLLFLG